MTYDQGYSDGFKDAVKMFKSLIENHPQHAVLNINSTHPANSLHVASAGIFYCGYPTNRVPQVGGKTAAQSAGKTGNAQQANQ